MQTLREPEWRERAAAHEARVDAATAAHLERRGDGRKHPVENFLFTYYALQTVAAAAVAPRSGRRPGSRAALRLNATGAISTWSKVWPRSTWPASWRHLATPSGSYATC